MKGLLLLFAFFLFFHNSFAYENLKKEKKALTETIKQEYDSWSNSDVHKQNTSTRIDVFASRNDHILAPGVQKQNNQLKKNTSYKTYNSIDSDSFSDFEFQIVNNQAIVQFKVNYQAISAFLEKKNGSWKLVCAAKIDEVL